MKWSVAIDLDADTVDRIVRHSLKESIDSVLNMMMYYKKNLERDAGLSYREVEYFDKSLQESQEDLEALKHVYNYFAPTEEHID